ncbi:WXG100 family type VII secretion target [Crossiella equi]|uniref:WXG100 family type VII secretion target n=1 Tax=Crossiella equi TaxID=130796 RepID=A0ABS5AGQ4_9PSEU|nr:WXG100 family type VII secretion target [Crossiella equi]MBP2475766.1 WXG100 family type VII secretion target [Crossiella equi]
MSARDAVASLPGGQALAELCDKVDGDPDAIRAIAQRWTDAATRAGECAGAVRKSVAGLDAAWQGSSADGFVGYMGRFGAAAGSAQTTLTSAAGDLRAAADALSGAEQALGTICENLLTRVRAFRQQAKNQPEEDVRPVIEGYVREAVEDAKPKVTEAENALRGALGALKGRTPEPRFSKLDAPDGQAFTPAPGKQVDWQPTPEPPKQEPPAERPRDGGGHGGSGGGSGTGGGGGGGGGLGPSGAPPPGGGPAPQGQVAEWINQAIEILKAQGYPVDKMNPNDIWMIIQKESGGNPHAINNWDSNAAKGTPSKGLMQTIDPTFNRWSLPGHKDIWNPVDNIIAGIRYSVERYGSVSNVPGVVGMKTGSGYRGY